MGKQFEFLFIGGPRDGVTMTAAEIYNLVGCDRPNPVKVDGYSRQCIEIGERVAAVCAFSALSSEDVLRMLIGCYPSKDVINVSELPDHIAEEMRRGIAATESGQCTSGSGASRYVNIGVGDFHDYGSLFRAIMTAGHDPKIKVRFTSPEAFDNAKVATDCRGKHAVTAGEGACKVFGREIEVSYGPGFEVNGSFI